MPKKSSLGDLGAKMAIAKYFYYVSNVDFNKENTMQRPAMFCGAPPYIFKKARELRKSMTRAEELLWEHLSKRQLKGCKFRRQHPMSEFIADFYCHSAKVVIEVDGGIHKLNRQKEYDILRTHKMNKFGVKVIRFTNEEIENNMEDVLSKIAICLDA